jgi:hypothetical protein
MFGRVNFVFHQLLLHVNLYVTMPNMFIHREAYPTLSKINEINRKEVNTATGYRNSILYEIFGAHSVQSIAYITQDSWNDVW